MRAILSFLFCVAGVALLTWRLVRKEDMQHSEGYFLGGRSLPWFVVAGSMMMTNISTEQLVGLNGGAYLTGMNVMGWEVTAAIALVLLALVLLPIYLRNGLTTLPQLLASRYDTNVRSLFSMTVILHLLFCNMPFVMYTGALSLVGLFGIPEMFSLGQNQAVLYTAIALGFAGGAYAVLGGLKAVAVADTINGVGLVIGGVAVTLLGLLYLGHGSLPEALHVIRIHHPEKLDAVSAPHASVPFGTLFTGMFLINVFFWCLNQNIIQRTFGSKNLAEGQKGVMAAGLLKILGVFILVVPGIVSFHIFDGKLPHSDFAYPRLVQLVLPVWMTGFFGAVLFGAIMSSFSSTLHSLATLFSVDIYKNMIRSRASDAETVLAGKILSLLLTAACIAIVPFLFNSQGGVFELMKKVAGFTFAGSTCIVIMGLLYSRTTPVAAYVGFPLGAAFFAYFGWIRDGLLFGSGEGAFRIHWLHLQAINVVVVFLVMLVIRRLIPATESSGTAEVIKVNVDMTPWKAAPWAGGALILLVIAAYLLFSPWGLAH